MIVANRVGALLATASTALCLAACSPGRAAPANQDSVIPVATAEVQQRVVPRSVNVVGTVESTGMVTLQSRVDGQITRVYVHDGDEVRAGERLFQIDPAPFELQVRMAQATLARDRALLENARAKEHHGAELEQQHYIAADAFTQLETDLASAAAVVDQDRAALDNAKLQLQYATITAPVAGKIGHIAQQVGNTVRAATQTPLTTLNILDEVEVVFALPEQELATVRLAMGAERDPLAVTASSVGAESAQATGKLTFIDNSADPVTGTIRLRAQFDNRDRVLWPGQLVNIALNLPTTGPELTIPSAALGESAQGSYVFIVNRAGLAEQRTVQILRTTSDAAVVSGVLAGERVVIDGQSRLTPNAHVRDVMGRSPNAAEHMDVRERQRQRQPQRRQPT